MNVLSLEALLNSLWSSAWVLLFAIPALLFYGYVGDGVFFEGRGKVRSGSLGEVDAIVGVILLLLFGTIVFAGFFAGSTPASQRLPTGGQMIGGVVISTGAFLAIIGGVIASMVVRGVPWREALGLTWFNPAKVVLCAALLIVLALPLVQLGLVLTQDLFGTGKAGDNSQDIVRFLSTSGDRAVRLVVAASAVIIAPFQEELIFRGFIYGVVRRYLGPAVGLIVNAALFAGIHLHAPSLGGLFALAACLTLAYEWTGSLYVPMTMHALFNSLSVVTLLSGGGNG